MAATARMTENAAAATNTTPTAIATIDAPTFSTCTAVSNASTRASVDIISRYADNQREKSHTFYVHI